MAHELENHNLYKTFAAYFHRNDLPKLGVYYDERAAEENVHHRWIYNYLIECDAEFSYPQVPAINVDVIEFSDQQPLVKEEYGYMASEIYQKMKDIICYYNVKSELPEVKKN